jgi:hypothetical protein
MKIFTFIFVVLSAANAQADSLECKLSLTDKRNPPEEIAIQSAEIMKFQYQTALDIAVPSQEAQVKISLLDTQLHVAISSKDQVLHEWKRAFSTERPNQSSMIFKGTTVTLKWDCSVKATDLKGSIAQAIVRGSRLRELTRNAESLAKFSQGDYKDTAICAHAVRLQDDYTVFNEVASQHKILLGESMRASFKQLMRHMKIIAKNCTSAEAPFIRAELAKAAADAVVAARELNRAI